MANVPATPEILDPSTLDLKNFLVNGLREILNLYSVAFTQRDKKEILFEMLRHHCIVNFPTPIGVDSNSLIEANFTLEQIRDILRKYSIPFEENFDRTAVFNLFHDHCLLNYQRPPEDSLFIHPISFSRANFITLKSVRDLLDARHISYAQSETLDVIFNKLRAWVDDPTKNSRTNTVPLQPGSSGAPTDPTTDTVRIQTNLALEAADLQAALHPPIHEELQLLRNALAESEKRREAVEAQILRERSQLAAENAASIVSSHSSQIEPSPKRPRPSSGLNFGFQDEVAPSPTGATPLRDFSFDSMFKSSTEILETCLPGSPITRHLVQCTASDLRMGAIVYLLVRMNTAGNVKDFFLLYQVTAVTMNYAAVRRISDCSEIPAAIRPPTEGRVGTTCPMLALSDASITYLRGFFPRVAQHGYSCEWPSRVSATTPASLTTRRVAFQPIDLSGCDLAGERMDTSSDVAFLGASSSSSSSSALAAPAPARASENTNPSASAIADKLHDIVVGSTSKCTIKSVVKDTATLSVVSDEPARLAAQGNSDLFLLLSHCTPPNNTRASHWSIERFRTQLQPAHFLLMYHNITSVDIRLFADMYETMGENMSLQLYETNKSAITDVSTTLPFDFTIMGNNRDRFRRLLANFCFAIDSMLCLSASIRSALHAMYTRIVDFVFKLDLDPMEPATPLLYLFWAYYFQHHVSQAYEYIRVKSFSTQQNVIDHLASFPPTATTDRLMAKHNDIRLLRELPHGFPLQYIATNLAPPPASITHSAGGASAQTRTAVPAGAAPAPSPASARTGLCMFFLCEQTAKNYCKNGATCKFAHRGPANKTEKDAVKKWFGNHKGMTLQAKYQ